MGAFIDCIDKASGNTFQAFLPATLKQTFNPNQAWLDQFWALDEAIKSSQNQYCLADDQPFMRFNAGANCLKEGRKITRKQLALANLGLGANYPLAVEILRHIQDYRRSIAVGTHEGPFELLTLTNMHAQISPDLGIAGNIRQAQNWIGGTSPFDAFYVSPPADEVPRLMADIIEFINRDDIPASLQAAVAHLQLSITHPFSDGNGRIARALVEVILRRRGVVTQVAPPVFLYRVGHNQDGYVEAIKSFEQGHHQHLYEFWLKANDWSIRLLQDKKDKQQAFEQSAFAKLPLLSPLAPETKVIKQLFEQPIVTLQSLSNDLNCTIEQAGHIATRLQTAGVLVLRQLREPKGQFIWDSPMVFEQLRTLDSLIFDNQ